MSDDIIKIALADDHRLFRQGLAEILNNIKGYQVIIEADQGEDLLEQLEAKDFPDLVLLDINMPVMNGFETCLQIRKRYPDLKILALSMYDDEQTIIRMVKNGANGYILKDIETYELKIALDSVVSKGFYYSDIASLALANTIQPKKKAQELVELSDKERAFLQLICSEKTYKEIAEEMGISPRTVDGYRENLFNKLQVKSRVGLVMYAIENHIYTM